MLPPARAIVAEIAGERFLSPRHLARRNDWRKGGDALEAPRMVQRNRQRAMATHRVAGDALAVHVDRKLCLDEPRQLLRHIAPHAEVLRPRLLGRIDIEARAL